MTAYEMADLAQSNFSNSIAGMALYLTLVFAYLAAAYLDCPQSGRHFQAMI